MEILLNESERLITRAKYGDLAVVRRTRNQGRRQLQNSGVDTHGERGEREPITGVWGQSAQRGPGAEPLVRESGGRSPPEAKNLFSFWSPTEAANLLHSPYFVYSLNPQATVLGLHVKILKITSTMAWTILCIR